MHIQIRCGEIKLICDQKDMNSRAKVESINLKMLDTWGLQETIIYKFSPMVRFIDKDFKAWIIDWGIFKWVM